MKTKILAVLLGSLALSAFADSSSAVMTSQAIVTSTSTAQPMVLSGMPGATLMNMNLVNNPGQSPKVVVNVGSPATLTVYDQDNKVALATQIPAGKTTIDTTNFPLGNDLLVVTVNQNGSTLTMKQAVYVGSPQQQSNS